MTVIDCLSSITRYSKPDGMRLIIDHPGDDHAAMAYGHLLLLHLLLADVLVNPMVTCTPTNGTADHGAGVCCPLDSIAQHVQNCRSSNASDCENSNRCPSVMG